MANVKADAAYSRSYNDGIPPFLWNRPPAFVQHCMDRIEKAEVLERKDIQPVQDDIFHVKISKSFFLTLLKCILCVLLFCIGIIYICYFIILSGIFEVALNVNSF